MKIGVIGVSGFIGRRLATIAAEEGHEVVGFSRAPERPIPGCSQIRSLTARDPDPIADLDAIVNLAGESVAGRWTRARRRRILESRVATARRLVDRLRESGARGPRALVNASAIGYYGDAGERVLDEGAPRGTGFLADVVEAWERAALGARAPGRRVALLRIGLVLGPGGGALRPLATLFRLGLGGRVGSGRQWMSWIHLDDVARMALRAATDDEIEGAWNAVAPEPCRNVAFTRALAAAARRPAPFPAPAPLLRLALGEASRLLLDSVRARNARVPSFAYRHPALEEALQDALAPART